MIWKQDALPELLSLLRLTELATRIHLYKTLENPKKIVFWLLGTTMVESFLIIARKRSSLRF